MQNTIGGSDCDCKGPHCTTGADWRIKYQLVDAATGNKVTFRELDACGPCKALVMDCRIDAEISKINADGFPVLVVPKGRLTRM